MAIRDTAAGRGPAGRRRAGRPRTTVLTRDRIVAAALELIDEQGAEEFSLTVLAERMGVRPSSFYNHTSGKDDILSGVQELVTDTIDDSMWDELPWSEAVAAWAHSYRKAFVGHPNAIVLFATAPLGGMARTLRMYERVVTAFERSGWPRAEIIPTLIALESFLLGSALDAVAPAAQLAPGEEAAAVPRFAAAVASRDRLAGRKKKSGADLAFDAGLQAMIVGFTARLTRATG